VFWQSSGDMNTGTAKEILIIADITKMEDENL